MSILSSLKSTFYIFFNDDMWSISLGVPVITTYHYHHIIAITTIIPPPKNWSKIPFSTNTSHKYTTTNSQKQYTTMLHQLTKAIPHKTISHLILSDIHLEFNPTIKCLKSLIDNFPSLSTTTMNSPLLDQTKTHNKIFILAGDIGNPYQDNYWSFLQDASNRFAHVLITTGNHEYYTNHKYPKTIEYTNKYIRARLDKMAHNNINNIKFLNRNSIQLNGINYIGTTLWTNIPMFYQSNIQKRMNDYRQIYYDETKLLTPHISTQIHIKDVKFIKQSIQQNTPNIIITHHLPIPELSHPMYSKFGILRHAFYTDLINTMSFSNINLWICGHTHTPMSYKNEETNTLFVTNPLGYLQSHKNNHSILEIVIWFFVWFIIWLFGHLFQY